MAESERPAGQDGAPSVPADVVVTDEGTVGQDCEPVNLAETPCLEVHPAASIFPLLEGHAFEALRDDIAAHGQREPIVLHLGKILDGRNRYRACRELGLEPRTIDRDDIEDPVAFTISVNLHRRHLNESQRALVGAKIEERLAAEAKRRSGTRTDLGASLPPGSGKARDVAAAVVNVSGRSVSTAKDVLERGAPELIRAVERGDVTVSAADQILALPKDAQARAARKGKKGVAIAARKLRAQRQAESQAAEALCAGRFNVILADAQEDVPSLKHRINEAAAADCVLFLTGAGAHLDRAIRSVALFGFTYRASLVWSHSQAIDGDYAVTNHDLVLVATRGAPPIPPADARPASVLEAPQGEAGEIPEQLFSVIERMYPALPRIDLVARGKREGWAVWDNGAESRPDLGGLVLGTP